MRIEVGIEDEKQPLNAEIGLILAGVELIAKRSQICIIPVRAIELQPKPGKVRHLVSVEVFTEEELPILQNRKAAGKRSRLRKNSKRASFRDTAVPSNQLISLSWQ